MIVLDASAAVDLLLERGERAAWVERWLDDDEVVAAPHLIDLEVASAMRRRELAGELGAARGRASLEDFASMPLRRYPTTELLGRVWQLRRILTACDAAYVALAEVLDVTLVTMDARLGRSRGHGATIEAYPG